MRAQVKKAYIQQFSEIVTGLPEETIRQIIAYAQRIRQKVEEPVVPLDTEEILALASKRAEHLRRQPRPILEAQYRALVDALEAEVIAKGIEIEEYPSGD